MSHVVQKMMNTFLEESVSSSFFFFYSLLLEYSVVKKEIDKQVVFRYLHLSRLVKKGG